MTPREGTAPMATLRESNTTSGRSPRPRRALGALAARGAVAVLAGCLSANQTKMVARVNASRRSSGLGALAANEQTATKAQAWADHMARTGVVEHTGGASRINTSGIPKWCSVG